MSRNAIVITTINRPTLAIEKIAATRPDWHFIVVGDRKTPSDWAYPGVDFLSMARQEELGHSFVDVCPPNHYARKNIGYLHAMAAGANVIAETDDDNIPYDHFLGDVSRAVTGRKVDRPGWENVYTHFTRERIWPRGLPLELINSSLHGPSPLSADDVFDCAIQQFLADGDPDVDAVFRLTDDRETYFDKNTVILGAGTFCPFNSQNTVWWPEAFTLLYLPSFVSFRMTDIWRSFIAQICLYRLGGHIAFREATVKQVRNQHSLLHDFKDEIPGYLHNAAIVQRLMRLDLSGDSQDVGRNLWRCYEALVEMGVVPEKELPLVQRWLHDVAMLTRPKAAASVEEYV